MDENGNFWNWSDNKSELILYNSAQEQQEIVFMFEACTIGEGEYELIVSNGEEKTAYSINSQLNKVCEMSLSLSPGINKLSFQSNAPNMKTEKDARNMNFQIRNYKILKN